MPFLLLCLAATRLSAATNLSDQIPPLRPPRGEIPPGYWETYGLLTVAGSVLGLVLLGLAGWLLTRRKPPAMPAPETLARQALEPLRRQPEDGVVLSRVSRILRRYLVAAFGLPAEELTRAEFCAALRQNQAIGGDLSAGVEQFLRRCDERKFAPQAPQPPLGAVDQALAFVEAARRRLMADSNPKSEPPLPSSNAPAANREL